MIAVPWYNDQAEYESLLQVADDTPQLFATFGEWKQEASKVTASLEDNGYEVVRVPLCVDRWVRWCGEQNLEKTEQSRSLYVARIARLLELHQESTDHDS